jgi:hypothetical protein
LITFILTIIFFITAVLYAAVGLGGGSGYLAVMELMGTAPEIMRPVSLALNTLVAGIGAWKHVRAGQFSARLFWPVALTSIPLAFIGGRLTLPGKLYHAIVGAILLYAAVRLWSSTNGKAGMERETAVVSPWIILIAGAAIGLLSGLVGMGGGVFLGPLLLLSGWSDTRQTMGITAAFVLVNSIAGLAGNLSAVQAWPGQIPLWLLVAGSGAWLGAELGSRLLEPVRLQQLLALALVVTALWMLFRL